VSLSFDPPVDHRPPDGAARAVTIEEAFEVLSNRRRRYVVHWLLEAETGTEIRELSRQVAAWENDKPLDRVTSQERRRVYNALQQFHLPKLDEAGVVRYDADRGTIEPTESLSTLRTYLNVSRRSHRWCLRSLAAGGAVIGLVALLVGVASLAPLPGTVLGVLSAAVVAGSVFAHRSAGSADRSEPLSTGSDDTQP
jgi:hypothetical protein